MPDNIAGNLYLILVSIFLVLLNAFFVAAEFALVKLRKSRVEIMIRNRRAFSKTAMWLMNHLNSSLSACQLGITMASLGLGWIGEPALASLLRPLFSMLNIESEAALHSAAFLTAFFAITAAHIVVGELAPKTIAIVKPEITLLSCSMPLKLFYTATFPFMWLLNKSADLLLLPFGLSAGASSLETPFSEEELRSVLAGAHAGGELTERKHKLLDSIFDMDRRLARQIMVPRPDVAFLRVSQSMDECLDTARQTKHTRFPLCENSMDDVIGVVHIKDLLVNLSSSDFDLKRFARHPRYVPETLPVSSLLKKFQASKQHLAFVLDEHGAIQGIVTLENVIEVLVGAVQDEFDDEDPSIVPDGSGAFMVLGATSLEKINKRLGIALDAPRVDTISGLLFRKAGRVLKVGDRIDLGPVTAEVIEVRSSRAWKIRISTTRPDSPST